ncbi:MAG: 2' O-ribose methyltransferase [Phylliscum demangeonii]|nr:MAG: 2' O-ribose methyltransferase [Phylliscum demangeonii]
MLYRRLTSNLVYRAGAEDVFSLQDRCLACQLLQRWRTTVQTTPSQTRQRRGASSSSSSSSQRWQSRQGQDHFSREARVQGLKSRAAFKLLEMNEKYKLLKKGQTVVDLGYAPGSWLQVAVDRTAPDGRVIGIDIIPAQPPKGASTIQGNFLAASVQAEVRKFLRDPDRGRPRPQRIFADDDGEHNDGDANKEGGKDEAAAEGLTEEDWDERERGYVDLERHASLESAYGGPATAADGRPPSARAKEEAEGRNVDVVLSDMSAPWEQTTGFWKRSLSAPYSRMMNTSGLTFRDHVGSMDLCTAALHFCYDTLRTGGHFVCKFYQGAEDKAFEKRLKKLFKTVHREKPEASRNTSKEAYFVALRRKNNIPRQEVFRDP